MIYACMFKVSKYQMSMEPIYVHLREGGGGGEVSISHHPGFPRSSWEVGGKVGMSELCWSDASVCRFLRQARICRLIFDK